MASVLARDSELLGVATNNVAEYRGLLLGLELARSQGATEVEVVNDSELVAKQVNGVYKVKHPDMRPLHAQALAALQAFDRWKVRSVPREQNAAADALVNEALDARRVRSVLSARNRELLGAPARRTARHRRLRRDLHPVRQPPLGGFADLRRRIPRAVPRRPPRDPPRAAQRRPLPVPARGGAREHRDREIYRISPTLARQQAKWLVIGLALFAATIVVFRDGRYLALENYRYLIAIAGIGSMLLPRLPGIGGQVNGAYLAVHVGSISFQPSEFGKIAIVIFLASYLRDNRQLLVTAGRRILGITIPPMKQFGPLLLVWGIRDGDAARDARDRHVADVLRRVPRAALRRDRARASFPLVGLVLFAVGAYYLGTHVGHIHDRVLAWEHPFSHALYDQPERPTSSPTACSRRPTAACSASASASR